MLLKHWFFKALAVVLVLSALVAGLIVPLNPGIAELSPSAAVPGDSIRFTIYGYNTHFTQAGEELRFWLKKDSAVLCGQNVRVMDDLHAEVTFVMPEDLALPEGRKELTIIANNPVDGIIGLADALKVPKAPSSAYGKTLQSCVIAGLADADLGFRFPFRTMLYESIRNIFYHVPMWFSMILLFAGSVFYAIRYLLYQKIEEDIRAVELVNTGILFGLLGLATGMVWAKYTWGDWWSNDIKQINSAIALLIYFAYIILRGSITEERLRAKVSAVYNIFAFAALIPLLFIIPSMMDSLHPGSGGNPGFNAYDLDDRLRVVFYPAVLGWFLLGLWMASVRIRLSIIQNKLMEND